MRCDWIHDFDRIGRARFCRGAFARRENDMRGIDATLSELNLPGFVTRRSRWRVNAGLDDFHPFRMKVVEFGQDLQD